MLWITIHSLSVSILKKYDTNKEYKLNMHNYKITILNDDGNYS